MTSQETIAILGNGDYSKGLNILQSLAERFIYARNKHKWKGRNKIYGYKAISDELRELDKAITYETDERIEDEALDVAVTAIRFVGREWE